MKRERVSHSLRHRVLNYYHHHWLQCKGINRQTLFDDTPFCMHTEIALATTRKLLQVVRQYLRLLLLVTTSLIAA